jgi:large subunit ribosomal protein L6
MSRIGNRVLTIPAGVEVNVNEDKITVKGPKGSLEFPLSKSVIVKVEGNTVTVERNEKKADSNVMQGTTNAIINNMIEGVSKGFEKGLEIIGVGYRFQVQGNSLTVNAGYSHPVKMEVPTGLSVEQVSNTEITVKGIDKELVGEFAANIRKVRKPEPYKGKGIRYKGEFVRRKEGKKAAK